MAIALSKVFDKANLSICLFLFILFAPYLIGAQSQTPSITDISEAYWQFFNFQLDSTRIALASLPNLPETFHLDILLTSTQAILRDDATACTTCNDQENRLLEKLSKFENEFATSDFNYLKAEIRLQWALIKLKNNEELAAFWNLKQAYSIATSNVSNYPEHLPTVRTLGLMHVLLGAFPEKYKWILPLFGMEANISQGLRQIDKAQNDRGFASVESSLILALIHTYWLSDPGRAVEILKPLRQKQQLLVCDYVLSLALMKDARSEEALSIINETATSHTQPFAIPQFYYLLGEIYLQKGQFEASIANYRLFIRQYEGNNLKKDSYYKMGVSQTLMNNVSAARQNFEKSASLAWAEIEADKNARYAVENEQITCAALYKMRYATDGGYYEKALKARHSIDPTTLNAHDRCEYHYRTARLHHKMDRLEAAKAAYQKAIDTQLQNDWYFAPNAALQLAGMFYDDNQLDNAKTFLKRINEYDGYPYQGSISQQAAALGKKLAIAD